MTRPVVSDSTPQLQKEQGHPMNTKEEFPLVSIVIRSMDRPTLRKALSSIAIQTYSNIEVVVVNAKGGGHTDIGDFCGNFKIRIVNSAGPTLSRPAAANIGLRAATGQYLMFLDDDDWLLAEHVAKLVYVLVRSHSNALAVHTAVAGINGVGQPTGTIYDNPYDPVRLMFENHLPIHSVLFSRRLLDVGCMFDETLELLEHWDFWLQVSCHTSIPFVPGVSAHYLIHESSGVREFNEITHSINVRFFQKWRSLWPESVFVNAMYRMNKFHALTVAVSERDSQLASLSQSVAERDNQITSLNQSVAERDNQITSLNQSVAERDNQITSLNQGIADARRELAQVLASKSWRITKPLRFSRRVALSKPYIATRRALSDNSRALWRALPISYERKRSLKGFLFKISPWIFRWSKAYQAWNAFNAPVNYAPMPDAADRQPRESAGEYVPLIKASPLEHKPAKLICFYLPQFHAIPENDEWWGEGFTEWTNVQPAQPQFEGHYQPHVPGELGYYNLLDPAVQRRQVELAKLYGIDGFCFYFYWFGGKRLLEAPIENYLNDKTLDLPFCLCWANENWSRRWDGLDSEILMAQQHSVDDDLAFIQHVARYMRDPRYIRINGKPLLLVYRPSLLPSALKTASRWRDWCRANGVGEIYLAYTQSFETPDPAKYGFDAAIEFPPNNSAPPNITDSVTPIGDTFGSTVYDWRVFVERSEHYKQQPYTLFRSVCPSWDNTARRKNRGTVFLSSTPALYQRWLENAIRDTQAHRPDPDERLIFVNAWNEWAEGAHLEPDARYGYAHLNATLKALLVCSGSDACANVPEETASRHQSVVDTRWNRVSAIFVEAPERGLFGFLGDYVALLAQASQHGASFSLENHVPCCEVSGERIVLDRRESLSRLGSSFNNKRVFCFVVLQYNKVELTEQCVASLRKLDHCGRDVRIVIVDNKSSDEVRTRTQEAFGSAPDVTVLYSDANLGFSGGNNLGYEYAREKLGAEFMVILNNDTAIEQGNFIREAVELYDRWGYSIAGPDIITPDGRHENPWNNYVYSIEEWETLRSIRRAEREHYLGHADATFRKIGKATPGSEIFLNPILQGAAYVVSPVFITDRDKIFDERLFLYGEEFVLAIDCLLSGHLTIYTNKLEVRHHEGMSTGDLPPHDKLMFGYDSAIKAISLSLKRLERHRAASLGSVIDFADIEKIDDCLDHNVPNVSVDLLFCQPGYHGGGEYGKAVFKALAEVNAKHGGFQLWAALNPNLFIDSWVWETCKANAINIVAVRSYDEIVQIVNSDRFDSFFTPAIVVYTGYEYMGKVGSHLPFTCKKTRVIGTLHDIRDFELARNRRQVLETRRKIGCLKESKMSESEINHAAQASLDQAEALRQMYRAIVQDETVDTIVTISSYCENSIKDNIGSPRKPLQVLASPQKRRPVPAPFVRNKFNPTSSPYALLLHAAREEKNGASAVVAFDQLFEESNNRGLLADFHVVLTGVTHLDQLGLAQIRHPDRFIALSELAPEQFEYLLKHARFLVYPSFNEGFGYPPVEVMTYGVPSIVSNATAIPEVCGHAVKYFDPYNLGSIKEAILNILSDGIDKNIIFEQYNLVTEKQNADLKILVGLIVGKNRFSRQIVRHQFDTNCAKKFIYRASAGA
jgi:GT2 family glycosyltransferase